MKGFESAIYSHSGSQSFHVARVHKTCHPSSDLNLGLFILPHFSLMRFQSYLIKSTSFHQKYINPASFASVHILSQQKMCCQGVTLCAPIELLPANIQFSEIYNRSYDSVDRNSQGSVNIQMALNFSKKYSPKSLSNSTNHKYSFEILPGIKRNMMVWSYLYLE